MNVIELNSTLSLKEVERQGGNIDCFWTTYDVSRYKFEVMKYLYGWHEILENSSSTGVFLFFNDFMTGDVFVIIPKNTEKCFNAKYKDALINTFP